MTYIILPVAYQLVSFYSNVSKFTHISILSTLLEFGDEEFPLLFTGLDLFR